MQPLCIKCFGKGLCGRSRCPIQAKISVQKKIKVDKDFQGQSPNVFVGRFNYPQINVGILATPEEKHNDDPKYWTENNYSISKIIEKRISLVNSSFQSNAIQFNSKIRNKFFDIAKEVSLSTKSTDMEVNLEDKPQFRISFNQDVMPHGPKKNLKKVAITSNTKIPNKVEKITQDTDLDSATGLNILYNKGYDEHYLTKIFSLGNLGYDKKRRLVPTRWSITATDDILGKDILNKIRTYDENSEFSTFFGGLLGNYYLVIFMPGFFRYELFETYLPKTIWNQQNSISFTTDYEDYSGRKYYAQNTAGGYYAARLPVLEYLEKHKLQSEVLAIRFITPDYYAPLGVWYCRQAIRKCLENKPINFSSKEYLLKYIKSLTSKKFNIDINSIVSKSQLLNKKQLRIKDFLTNN